MLSMDWIFEGIGTQLLMGVIGLTAAGAGAWLFYKNSVRQKQKAGKNSIQLQSGRDINIER
jgi:hypothetical protein